MTNFLSKEPARQILISNSVQILNVAKVSSFPILVSSPSYPHLITDEASFFSCMACRVKTCLSCAVKFHSGITCADYKESQKEQTFSEVRSKGWLSRNAKLCVCGRWVWKTEGCDHITCVCGKEWCYICGVSYKLIGKLGNAAHKKNCKHYRSMHSGGPTPIQM